MEKYLVKSVGTLLNTPQQNKLYLQYILMGPGGTGWCVFVVPRCREFRTASDWPIGVTSTAPVSETGIGVNILGLLES